MLKYQPKKEKIYISNQPTLLQVLHLTSILNPLFFIASSSLQQQELDSTRSLLFLRPHLGFVPLYLSIGPAVSPEPDARPGHNESTLEIEVVARVSIQR